MPVLQNTSRKAVLLSYFFFFFGVRFHSQSLSGTKNVIILLILDSFREVNLLSFYISSKENCAMLCFEVDKWEDTLRLFVDIYFKW